VLTFLLRGAFADNAKYYCRLGVRDIMSAVYAHSRHLHVECVEALAQVRRASASTSTSTHKPAHRNTYTHTCLHAHHSHYSPPPTSTHPCGPLYTQIAFALDLSRLPVELRVLKHLVSDLIFSADRWAVTMGLRILGDLVHTDSNRSKVRRRPVQSHARGYRCSSSSKKQQHLSHTHTRARAHTHTHTHTHTRSTICSGVPISSACTNCCSFPTSTLHCTPSRPWCSSPRCVSVCRCRCLSICVCLYPPCI
jgi:hypothetical protein